jgi:hypothetical protein
VVEKDESLTHVQRRFWQQHQQYRDPVFRNVQSSRQASLFHFNTCDGVKLVQNMAYKGAVTARVVQIRINKHWYTAKILVDSIRTAPIAIVKDLEPLVKQHIRLVY